MNRGLMLSLLLLWTASAQANDFWNNLWRNADQRGEQLMKHGDAIAAAHTYSDHRRKAYAELQAGDYQNAAKDFSAFDDSDDNYNRGNALAQAGQLQDALKAYDAALARDPDNQDARHNRDLVAKALQQQPPQSQSSADKNSSSKDDKNGGKDSSGNNQADNKESKQGDNKQAGKQDSGKQGNAGNNSSAQNQNGKNQPGKNEQAQQGSNGNERKSEQGQQQSAMNAQNQNAQPGVNDQTNPATQPQTDDAAQARRDAAAALGKSPAGNAEAMSNKPLSEQQLAQEQWLRRIPDDPGGLLRRKFMIEHMIRQQGGQP